MSRRHRRGEDPPRQAGPAVIVHCSEHGSNYGLQVGMLGRKGRWMCSHCWVDFISEECRNRAKSRGISWTMMGDHPEDGLGSGEEKPNKDKGEKE